MTERGQEVDGEATRGCEDGIVRISLLRIPIPSLLLIVVAGAWTRLLDEKDAQPLRRRLRLRLRLHRCLHCGFAVAADMTTLRCHIMPQDALTSSPILFICANAVLCEVVSRLLQVGKSKQGVVHVDLPLWIPSIPQQHSKHVKNSHKEGATI